MIMPSNYALRYTHSSYFFGSTGSTFCPIDYSIAYVAESYTCLWPMNLMIFTRGPYKRSCLYLEQRDDGMSGKPISLSIGT